MGLAGLDDCAGSRALYKADRPAPLTLSLYLLTSACGAPAARPFGGRRQLTLLKTWESLYFGYPKVAADCKIQTALTRRRFCVRGRSLRRKRLAC